MSGPVVTARAFPALDSPEVVLVVAAAFVSVIWWDWQPLAYALLVVALVLIVDRLAGGPPAT